MAIDICQLADVFEHFRSNCFIINTLDFAYLVLAPQLAWNVMFNMQNLKLISDPEMCRYI